MLKSHPLAPSGLDGIAVSPLLQSWYLYYESEVVPAKASELLNEVLGQKLTNRAQGQRLLSHYGTQPAVCRQLVHPLEQSELSLGVLRPTQQEPEVIYAMFDGLMLPQDGAYEETKIGRVFRASQVSSTKGTTGDQGGKACTRAKVFNSEYIAQRGHYTNFTKPFGQLIDAQRKAYPEAKLVVITDRAAWMRDWIGTKYENCTYILDFFHAYEHLCDFAKTAIKIDDNRHEKLADWKKGLRQGRAPEILKEIKSYLDSTTAAIANEAQKLSTYLANNLVRMKYDEYRDQGLLIGSGAIESAARSIVQQRCKLSGQRWCDEGSLQAVLNLRALYKSGKRKRMDKIILANYRKAA
jgi:hypothetical protein